jgi:hypothetical protein
VRRPRRRGDAEVEADGEGTVTPRRLPDREYRDGTGATFCVRVEIDEGAALDREILHLANKLRRSPTKQKVASAAGGVIRVWIVNEILPSPHHAWGLQAGYVRSGVAGVYVSTGRPLTVKCPKCRRGQWRRDPQVFGIQDMGRQIEVWRRTRRGRVLRTETFVRCGDCGHMWWITLRPRKCA